jgi:hypothetical protein
VSCSFGRWLEMSDIGTLSEHLKAILDWWNGDMRSAFTTAPLCRLQQTTKFNLSFLL